MILRRMRTLRCLSVRDEAPDVKTFIFATDDGMPIDFVAGQAVTLALQVAEDRLTRTFSISSAPGCDAIELTVKASADGRVTPWMHKAIVPGSRIEASAPHGKFVLGPVPREKIAFVSAGSGATPLMAMLRSLVGSDEDVTWFHSVRTPDDVLFGPRLAALQRQMPRLSVTVCVSRRAPGWFGYTGRVSRRLLSTAVPDLGRRDVFCCGPAGFMEAVKLIHAAEGGRAERFHTEHFRAPVLSASPTPVAAEATGDRFRITVQSGRTFEASMHETILEAAARQTVVIPCGCATGVCGTCRVRKLHGEVIMRQSGGLSPEEEAEDYILACSSRPLSDMTIDF